MVSAIGDSLVWRANGQSWTPNAQGVRPLFAAMGGSGFYGALTRMLSELAGVDDFHVFSLAAGKPDLIAKGSLDGGCGAGRQFEIYMQRCLWQQDSTILQLGPLEGAETLLLRTDAATVPCRRLREHWRQEQFAERLMMCGCEGGRPLAMTLVRRENRPFARDGLDRLALAANLLLPLLARHEELASERGSHIRALTSLPVIEGILAAADTGFPPRESQVCARLLYGMSAGAIAADLGLGTETVVSYRKRIYLRLSIGSHREMLLWYLQFSGGTAGRPSPQ